MAKAYYSNVFPQSADHIWSFIRDFNNYPVWVDGAGESHIEAGKSGDAVGAVRNVMYQGKNIRQKLLAAS
ncbi:MAG: SRPBCC family protein, partial [Xanthobacteraceae bacterium]